jgi:hypothetical protein
MRSKDRWTGYYRNREDMQTALRRSWRVWSPEQWQAEVARRHAEKAKTGAEL